MIIVTNDVNLLNSLIPSDNQRSRSKAKDAKVLHNHKSIDASKTRFFLTTTCSNVQRWMSPPCENLNSGLVMPCHQALRFKHCPLQKTIQKRHTTICKSALNIWKLVKLRLFGASRSWKTILLQYQVHENVICSKEVFDPKATQGTVQIQRNSKRLIFHLNLFCANDVDSVDVFWTFHCPARELESKKLFPEY